MSYDLNCKINPQKPFAQKEIVKSSVEDGYAGVAFSYEFTGALGSQHTNPLKKIDVVNLMNKDMNLLAKPEIRKNCENFKQYSRITLTVNDPRHITQVSDSNAIIQSYDIVAIKTTNQKIFYTFCLENDTVDIITFDLSEKLPFQLKRGPVTEAIKKGIMFEICYSQAIEDMSTRRMIFSNAIQIVRATKGKNIILSSGTDDAFYHRSPYDAMNLAAVLELSKDLAQKSVTENTVKCIQRAEFRKNYKGTISLATTEDQNKFFEKEAALLAKKKLKTDKVAAHNVNQQSAQKMEEETKINLAENTDKKMEEESNVDQTAVTIVHEEITATTIASGDNSQVVTTMEQIITTQSSGNPENI